MNTATLWARYSSPRTLFSSGLLMCLTVATLGCTAPVEKSDPDRARELLQQTLQAWKDGRRLEDLRSDKPPVYAADEKWKAGSKLVDFKIDPAAMPHGPSIMIYVDLDFGPERKQKRVSYLVSTTPALSVALNDQ